MPFDNKQYQRQWYLKNQEKQKARSREWKSNNRPSGSARVSWEAMKQRCNDSNASNYPMYGGRGIKVCERWLESYDNFLIDMGPRPVGKTLDRIKVNGNYEPGNCQWAAPFQQTHNRRSSK